MINNCGGLGEGLPNVTVAMENTTDIPKRTENIPEP